jgi:hypothetical protein
MHTQATTLDDWSDRPRLASVGRALCGADVADVADGSEASGPDALADLTAVDLLALALGSNLNDARVVAAGLRKVALLAEREASARVAMGQCGVCEQVVAVFASWQPLPPPGVAEAGFSAVRQLMREEGNKPRLVKEWVLRALAEALGGQGGERGMETAALWCVLPPHGHGLCRGHDGCPRL